MLHKSPGEQHKKGQQQSSPLHSPTLGGPFASDMQQSNTQALSLWLRILFRLEVSWGICSMGRGMGISGSGWKGVFCSAARTASDVAFQRCCSPVPGHHRNFTCIPTAWIFPWRRGRGWGEFQQETAGESLTHTLCLFFFHFFSLLHWVCSQGRCTEKDYPFSPNIEETFSYDSEGCVCFYTFLL